MTRSRPSLIASFCLAASLCVAGVGMVRSDPGLSIARDHYRLEGRGLGTDALFARVDSLEATFEESHGARRAEIAHRLGQLYLATDLVKHKRHALSLLELAVELDPTRFDAAGLRATTAHQMRYTQDAEKWLEEMTREYADDPRSHSMLGRFHFLEGRRRMLSARFEEARGAYERAVAADSTHVPAWYGLAATCLALEDHAAALRGARSLARCDSVDTVRPRLLEAAALAGLGRQAAADSLFGLALSDADERTQAVFEDAQGFLDERDLEQIAYRVMPQELAEAAMAREDEDYQVGDEVDWKTVVRDPEARRLAVEAYWRERNTRPTQLHNPRELLYWRRLVEADLLFGDPDEGLRGWDTEMGQTLVRWGRPTSTFYDPGTGGDILDELQVAGVRLPRGEAIPERTRLWIWTYKEPGAWFSFMFTDLTMNSKWKVSSSSGYAMEAIRRQQPLVFFDQDRLQPAFRIAVGRALFPRGRDDQMLETYVSVRPYEAFFQPPVESAEAVATVAEAVPAPATADSAAIVEWALYDEDERRIDYQRLAVGPSARRSALHRALGVPTLPDDGDDPYVVPIGARIRPGNYRLAVEVLGPPGTGRDAVVLQVEVPPGVPEGMLSMSDLQLASAYRPYRSDSRVPLRYVKYGQAVVPVPDLRVPVATPALSVYFELRHLGLDDRGRTRFDVSYEVFQSDREILDRTLGGDFERADLDRVDPLTLTFLEESTGTAPDGVVVKGAKLDVSSLERGDYVLVVTVRDRLSERTESRAVPFRKQG